MNVLFCKKEDGAIKPKLQTEKEKEKKTCVDLRCPYYSPIPFLGDQHLEEAQF